MNQLKKNIPNTLTLLSLTGGMLSIIFAFHTELMGYVPFIILLCALFDFLDGLTARWLGAYSDIGKELDSLADVVSFGVAPGILMFRLMEKGFAEFSSSFRLESASAWQWLLFACAFLIPAFSALRLAKFNLDTSQKTSFKGLPTPASGLFVVFLFLFLLKPDAHAFHSFLNHPLVLAFLSVALSFLMVSNLRMISLKFKHYRLSGNETRYLLLVSGLALIISLGAAGGMIAMLLYILLSVLFPPES